MKKLASGIILALSAFSLNSFAADGFRAEANEKCAELQAIDVSQLDTNYKTAKAGPIPDGLAVGCVIGNGKLISPKLSQRLNKLWNGKIFNRAEGTLRNRVLGDKTAFTAKVFLDESVADGQETIAIEYIGDGFISKIRDEIRLIEPGMYLGKMFYKTRNNDHVFVLYFSLFTNS